MTQIAQNGKNSLIAGNRALQANPTILIGDINGQHVLVRLVQRSHPQARDYWDGNWIESEVVARVGGFRASYRAALRSNEFQRFLNDVRTLHQSLAGVARFETMEEQLTISLTGDGKGGIRVTGACGDVAGARNRLAFEFEIDQTYLPPLCDALEAGLAHFPVIGTPAD